MTKPGVMDIEYRYTAGQNNGRIASAMDYLPAANLSQGKAASQSTGSGAANAVDGNTDPNGGTWTSAEANAWWQVDLGASAPIQSVTLWGRNTVYTRSVSVFVSTTPFADTDTPAVLRSRGVPNQQTILYPNATVTLTFNGQSGRYVRVQGEAWGDLQLAEVQVLGTTAAEEVTYGYDLLNRLTSAVTTGSGGWGTTYAYDGWGNLTDKTPVKGAPPVLHVTYDATLNMVSGSNPPSYMWTGYTEQYDGEDRPAGLYDPAGHLVMSGTTMTFYGIGGQKLAKYTCLYEDVSFGCTVASRTEHVGGQLTNLDGTGATTDRLGSVVAKDNGERYGYYPYGESKFASVGGGMYAGLESPVRGYDSNLARFDRPHPLGMKGVVMGDPGSWNRFGYVGGDPVNFRDPKGLFRSALDEDNDDGWDPGFVYGVLLQSLQGPKFGPVAGDVQKLSQFSIDMRTSAHQAISQMGSGCKGALAGCGKTRFRRAPLSSKQLFRAI